MFTPITYHIIVEAKSFLYQQVRIMVATLTEIGLGKKTLDYVHKLLAARDRSKAPQAAPSQGLFLQKVFY